MNIISILFLILIITTTQSNQLPQSESIEELVPLQQKYFFITQSQKYFGFIEPQNGYLMMLQQVKQGQGIVGWSQKDNFFALRKQRNKVLIFDLKHVNIEQINVQINFRHQKIIDLIKVQDVYYVLTNKDMRKYKQGEEMTQNTKNIMTSCRKNQWFLKLFMYQHHFRIVLVNAQELCIRIVQFGKKAQQKCLFNITSQPHSIKKVTSGILLQNQEINYVIKDNFEVFSFKGQISQVYHDSVTFFDNFQSFNLSNHSFMSGLTVYGSQQKENFMIKKDESSQLSLIYNHKIVQKLGNNDYKRFWISKKAEKTYTLILQQKNNELQFKKIQLKELEGKQIGLDL